jgi:hypothetical protein
MDVMNPQLWVEPVGDLVIARLRGRPTEALLRECQERVLAIMRDTGGYKVLYDALEMESPPVDVPLAQEEMDKRLGDTRIRRAIVVPNTRLAYLARLAFAESDYRVFYNDMTAAIEWLARPAVS